MFLWPLTDAKFHGVSSQTARTSTTKNVVSLLSDEASALRTAFTMSSDSYSGLAVHELVHQNWKEFMNAPKTASSGNAEQ